jgi:hypothetical protein
MAMPQPLTGWMSETGAIDKAPSKQSAPATSASNPIRQSGELAYSLRHFKSSESLDQGHQFGTARALM